jgi:hypothetical protein
MITIRICGNTLHIEGTDKVIIHKKVQAKKVDNKNLKISNKHQKVEISKKKHSKKELDAKVIPYFKVLGMPLLDYTKKIFRQLGTEEVDDTEIEAVISIMIEDFPGMKRYAKPDEIMEDIKAVLKGVKL